MTALSEKTRAHLLGELREEIAGVAWATGVQCNILQDYCSIGDDAGVEYSLRRITAYIRSAAFAFNRLHEIEKLDEPEKRGSIGGGV
jgi:hypothetical protein